MKFAWFVCLVYGTLALAAPQESSDSNVDSNINERYTVETVILTSKDWTANLQSETTNRISIGLLHQLTAIIGQKVNLAALDTLASNLKAELNAREVTHRLVRGETPQQVRVEFEVRPARASVGVNLNQFVYNSKEGWTGSGELAARVDQQTFAIGLVDNGDLLPERFSGVVARYENRRLWTDRLSFKFEATTVHSQWNQATVDAYASNTENIPALYRARQDFQPTATLTLAKPLTLSVGARVERFENGGPGDQIMNANALVTSLHFHQNFEGAGSDQELDADASLQAASRALESDYVYSMRTAGFRYEFHRGKSTLTDNAWGGYISGRAPLSDRFVLGNTTYLRGWNKFEIDPLGGNRVLYNSVEYHYGPFQAFYDAGAVWDESQPIVARQSVGIGLRESVLSLAVALPMRSGRVEPIFMMGILP